MTSNKYNNNPRLKQLINLFIICHACILSIALLGYMASTGNGDGYIWTDSYLRKSYNYTETDVIMHRCIDIYPLGTIFASLFSGIGSRKLSEIIDSECFQRPNWISIVLSVSVSIGQPLGFLFYSESLLELSTEITGKHFSTWSLLLIHMSTLLFCTWCVAYFIAYSILLHGIVEEWIFRGKQIEPTSINYQMKNVHESILNWIYIYKNIQESFTAFLFWEFVLAIEVCITFTYLSLTVFGQRGVYPSEFAWMLSVFARFLILSVSLVRCLSLTFLCDHAYKTIQDKVVLFTEHIAENDEIAKLDSWCIQNLSTLQPLSGHGFFEVKKSVISSLVTAIATYMIVMLQFKMSEK